MPVVVRFLYIILMSALLFSCKPGGALTPEDAFHDLGAACRRSDSRAVAVMLSGDSVKKIKSVTRMFSGMDEAQIRSISRYFGVSPEKMRNLSVEDYVALMMKEGGEGNVIVTATRYKIVSIDRSSRRALVRVENGMALTFVKEGPYWRLDMSDM